MDQAGNHLRSDSPGKEGHGKASRGTPPEYPDFGALSSLHESQRRLLTLMGNLPGMAYRCRMDRRWTMEFVSEGCRGLTGYDPNDLLDNRTLSYNDLIHPEDQEPVWREVQQAVEKGVSFQLTYRIRTAGGTWKWVWEQGIGVTSEEGKLKVLEGLILDITDQKRKEIRYQVFAHLGSQLSSANTEQEAARTIAGAADTLFAWDALWVNGYAPQSRTMRVILAYDMVDGERRDESSARSDILPGPNARRAIEEGRFLMLRDSTETFPPGAEPFGDSRRPSASLMFVPIRKGSEVFGVISVQSYRADAYSQSDLDDLQALADLCGGALERIQAESALRESEEKYRTIFDNAQVGVYRTRTEDGLLLLANQRMAEMLGYPSPEQAVGQYRTSEHYVDAETRVSILSLIREHGLFDRYEARLTRIDGEVRWFRFSGRVPPGRDYVDGVAIDITEMKSAEQKLRHDSLHDTLTRLPNRLLYFDRLAHAIRRTRRNPRFEFAVIFLDVDDFKRINDSLGHRFGDELLLEVGRRLTRCLRPEDTVARFGGDEFAVLLEGTQGTNSAMLVAQRLIDAISHPVEYEGREVHLSASFGAVTSGLGHQRPEEYLRDADTAMYRAKRQGKNRCVFFDPTMHAEAVHRLFLEEELRRALPENQFVLYYQPIVELDSTGIVGFEALLRWDHPERGLVPPLQFIPVAEETGLIVPLGKWVIEESCRQGAAWTLEFGRPIRIHVNLSARQLQETDFPGQVEAALRESGFDPALLHLEITETTLMEQGPETSGVLARLKSGGIHLALDDFGTGYSSLGYLSRLPLDTLKIDQTFVKHMMSKKEDLEIVRAVSALAATFGLDLVAEGIETDDQLEQLRAMRCHLGQGYFFARPLCAREAARALAGFPGNERPSGT